MFTGLPDLILRSVERSNDGRKRRVDQGVQNRRQRSLKKPPRRIYLKKKQKKRHKIKDEKSYRREIKL